MKYTLPISPFSDKHSKTNHNFKTCTDADEYLSKKYFNKDFIYTSSGRNAIKIALEQLKLSADDIVTIVTTTDNFYISSCVTEAIEKVCNWSRHMKPNTKVILVNHEFGFPRDNLIKLKKYNLPIIEDCAFSFDSQNDENSVGLYSDFVICSCPKYFAINTGGLLFYDKEKYNLNCSIDNEKKSYIQNVISVNIKCLSDIRGHRRNLYRYYTKTFEGIGLLPRFFLSQNVSPGAFVFKVTNNIDLTKLKVYLQSNGIECSVFYGEDAFFLPCNQSMEEKDVEDIYIFIKEFLSKTDD